MTGLRASLRWMVVPAWLAFAGLAVAGPPQRDFPRIPAPEGAKTYWIAEYLEQNTIPMQIRGIESPESMQAVSRFYEQWLADKQGDGVTNLGPVRILGARLGVYQVTVQLRDGPEGTYGRLVAAAVYEPLGDERERSERIGRGFPRPAGSQVISDTLSFDEGQRNRTIVVTNAVSVETNALYLREQMIRLGWTRVQDRTVDGGLQSGLVFRRNNEEMVVSIIRHDQASFVTASQTTPE